MRLGTDALKGVPAAGMLFGVAALAVAAAVYWSNFDARRHYLQQRNFRQMAILARQTERALDTQAHRINAKLQGDDVQKWWSNGPQMAKLVDNIEFPSATVKWALDPNRRGADTLRAALANVGGYRISTQPPGIEVAWGTEADGVTVNVPAAGVLGPVLEGRFTQQAFDTLALATPAGRVMVATGSRSEALRAMPLDGLLGQTSAASDGAFQKVARSIAMYPVRLAERDYFLFVQPCCKGGPASAQTEPALVLVGLVDATALQSAALSISPLFVFGAVVLVLAALVSWTFLKVRFTRAQQAVSPLDVLQLSTSSVFGVALATILILGTAAYVRMRADIDGQLRTLGQRIEAGMSAEIRAAYRQSLLVSEQLLTAPCADGSDTQAVATTSQCVAAALAQRPAVDQPYPDFATVALIDAKGRQTRKVYANQKSPDRIDVADRRYFQAVKSAATSANSELWSIDECLPATADDERADCILESVWSWGTGRAQAVLAHRSGDPRSADKGLPVSAIAFPMRSVIEPLLPVGFEFAVVSQRGDVLFHSDSQRMGEENLLVEADQNPRIRALMSAHSAGEVNTSYLGRDYRAHVRPAPIPGASIVTLFDKQHTRALALEWMAASLFLLSGYVIAWTVVMIAVLWSGTAWIWPDPFRRARYQWLSWLYAAMLLGFLAIWLRSNTTWTLTAGLALPVAAWIAAVLLLARRPAGVRGKQSWSALGLDYRLMAALLLAVTAVVPGITFATFSYNAHTESFVKHREIVLARRIGREPRKVRERLTGPADLGHYADIFYGSEVSIAADEPPAAGHQHEGFAHSLLEDVLPYYTAASVEMRELLHEASENESWRSAPPADGVLVVSVRTGATAPRIQVKASLPGLVALRAQAGDGAVVPWTVAALVLFLPLGVLIWWVVGFMERRIFLTDVIDRVWVKGRLVTSAGQHLLVVCRDPAAVAMKFEHAESAALTPLARQAEPSPSPALQKLSDRALPTMALVLADLDDDPDDAPLWQLKLLVLERLMADSDWTIVLVSRHSRDELKTRIEALDVEPPRRAAWQQLLASLNPVPLPDEVEAADDSLVITIGGPADDSGRSTAAIRRLLKRLVHPAQEPVWKPTSAQWRQALLLAEGRPTRDLRTICRRIAESDDVRSGFLNAEQILEEVAERARPLYQAAWNESTEDERVVLEHVARFGLTNSASQPVVRRLLARGLLRKDPELRPMNRTFKRFVLGPDCRKEVERLEGQAEASLWDRLRVPLGLGATIAVVFLVTTQREMFDATLTVATGMSTAVPTLIRLTTLLAGGSAVKDVRA